MNKKVVVITGTSSGVGLELAIMIAKHNYTVYATMRNLAKQETLLAKAKECGVNLNIVELDVTQNESIEKCFTDIINKEGHIDILVNNAGAGFIRSTEQASLDEIYWVTETNYLSVVKCVKAVIPYMRKQRSGHIINVSSVGGLVGQPFNELYCGAKFAVEGYTEAMASYLTHAFNINFTLVEPGGIKSDFAKNAMEVVQNTGGIYQDEYQPVLEEYLGNMRSRSADTSLYQTSSEVADVIWSKVINTQKPPLRIRTSVWAENLCKLKTDLDPDGLKLHKCVEEYFLGSK